MAWLLSTVASRLTKAEVRMAVMADPVSTNAERARSCTTQGTEGPEDEEEMGPWGLLVRGIVTAAESGGNKGSLWL
ncbi:hypothetical protein F4703DRAFT_1837630 [Phycomyces blakesleeanus]